MIETLTDCIGIASLVVAIAGAVYALCAATLLRRDAAAPADLAAPAPAVTILKPLAGAEACLAANLRSFCTLDYPGPVEVLFGVADAGDPAADVVKELVRAFPGRALRLFVTGQGRGANPKIENLAGMEAHVAHAIVVLADSDIAVSRDYLQRVVAALRAPGVGLVTCLYRGVAVRGLWSELSAMAIDHHFRPSVAVALRFGLAQPCFGATIALPRSTLARIGGFAAFRDELADDYAIGAAVRRLGLSIAIPPFTVAHVCADATFAELWRHELRWARTVRAVSPRGYAGAVIAHPLPFALVALAALGPGAAALSTLASVLAARLAVQWRADRGASRRLRRLALGPLRDLLSFAIYVGGWCVGAVNWRGRRYRVDDNGMLTPSEGPQA